MLLLFPLIILTAPNGVDTEGCLTGHKKFRDLREKYTEENKTFSGIAAADTLINYSQKKDEYIKLLKQMIKSNHWDKYDR